jgi:decaprenyl-phosphate phosphoribosyltransferase
VTSPQRPPARAAIAALRPKQWVKNILVFLPAAAAGSLDSASVAANAGVAFVAFCLVSSGTYVLNDVADVDADRRHPVKHRRPIAAGELDIGTARIAGIALLVAGTAIAWSQDTGLGAVVISYVALTTAYTLWLKHVAVLDLVGVAAGFLLRAAAGSAVTDVPISSWFFIVASAGAMFMVTGKRLAELRSGAESAQDTRSTLARYSVGYLVYVLGVASAVAVLGYCLWAFEAADLSAQGAVWIELSAVPFVVGLLRYGLLVDAGGGGEPEDLIWRDAVLLVAGVAWAVLFALGIYGY